MKTDIPQIPARKPMPFPLLGMRIAALFCAASLAVVGTAKAYAVNSENPPGLLAIAPDGNFYVITGDWAALRKVSPSGKELATIECFGHYLAIYKTGEMFAVDYDQIVKYTSDGTKVLRFSAPPPENDDNIHHSHRNPKQPFAVAIDSQGLVYVSYIGANVIDRFDASGKYLGEFVKLPTAGHRGMVFDPAGNLYVVNAADRTIEKIAPDGKDLGVFAAGNLKQPMEIALDKAGNVYVVDSPDPGIPDCSIRKFSPKGEDLGILVTLEGFGYHGCKGFAIDREGNLYVNSFWDGKVMKFSPEGKDLGPFVTDGQQNHAW